VVTGVEFSTDGRTLVTLSVDKDAEPGQGSAFLTRWDVASGHSLKGPVRISAHGGDVLLASRDGGRLVVVNGAEVLVEAAGTFQRLRHVPHRSAQPRPFVAALSPHDGRTLALWSEDGPIELLDLVGGQPRPVGRDEGGAWSIQFSPDGTTLVTGGAGTVKIWDVASGQLRETFQGHEARVADLRFSPDGRTLYSAGSKSVIAWDLEGSSRLGRPLSLFTGRFPYSPTLTSPHALAVSPDGTLLAEPVPTAPDHLTLLDLHDPRQARQLPAPGVGQISAMAFSRDGRRLAVAGSAPAPVLIDVASGKVQVRMTGGGHRDGVNSVGFDPKGEWLATGGVHDLQAIIWSIQTGRPVHRLSHPTTNEQEPVTVRWSPDGTTVATGGGSGKVILWRAADGRQVATLPADTSWVLTLAFSPDGRLLAASGTGDRQVTLWDVATRKRVGRLPHPIFIASMAFDPAGRTLATSAADGKVRLWDLASQREIGVPLPGAENGTGTNISAFDPSGNHLIAFYDSGAAFVWDMDTDHWKRQACTVVGRALTRDEWKELLPARRYQPACR
jgi:WD40 repeat protein